jgi:L-ascorbate metabolism protein UlaG (beta-lactamase superfamily)
MVNMRQSRLAWMVSFALLVMFAAPFASAQTSQQAVVDLNHDGVVNFADYVIFAKSWRQEASWLEPNAILGLQDFAAMANRWLEGSVPVTYVQWLGHSSVKVWAGDKVVYVDPRNLTTSPKDATVVLVTHSHSDHYSTDGIARVSQADTVFMAPPDIIAMYGKGQAIAPDQVVDVAGVRIIAVRAYNITTTNHPRANNWLGYIIQFGPQRIYVAGDTDLTDEMKALKDIDGAFLPAGGTYTMTAVQAAEATKYVNPVVAIPYHWGEIVGTVTDAQAFARAASSNAKVMTKGEILCSTDWGKDFSLITHWRLDEQAGNIVLDSAGSFQGTANGSPVWQPAAGVMAGAVQLDGQDDYISTPFVIDPSSGPFSVFAWVKGGAAGQAILSQIGGSNWLCVDSVTGCLGTELKVAGRTAKPLWSTAIVTDGAWRRVGLVWNGANRILYVDDIEVARDSTGAATAAKTGLYLGAGSSLQSGAFWSGLIDDVRVHNKAVKP